MRTLQFACISIAFFLLGLSTQGATTVWLDDENSAAIVNSKFQYTYYDDTPALYPWIWQGDKSSPLPISGTQTHTEKEFYALHEHVFGGSSSTLHIDSRDYLFAYVYLDPANPPAAVMLQWQATDGSGFSHRAYWGDDLFRANWGINNTTSRRRIGELPETGKWVRLEVPASAVGLAGLDVSGMAFTTVGGKTTWDQAGKTTEPTTDSVRRRETVRITWQDTSGKHAVWQLEGSHHFQSARIALQVNPAVGEIVASQDLDQDGNLDYLIRKPSGGLSIWYIKWSDVVRKYDFATDRFMPRTAKISGFADLNRDGNADLVWQDGNGIHIWFLNGPVVVLEQILVSLNADLIGLNDFNTDGYVDFLWQNPDRTLAISYLYGTGYLFTEYLNYGNPVAKQWRLRGIADFSGDGKSDLLWEHLSGRIAVWYMDGAKRIGNFSLHNGKPAAPGWKVVSVENPSSNSPTRLIRQPDINIK